MEARIVAAARHGVITRPELIELGLTPEMVDCRLRSGRLQRLHRGVYLLGDLVGGLRPRRSREMAAVLACGPRAWVSHQSCGALWEITSPERRGGPVHITLVGRACARPGIRAHRVRELPAEDATVLDGIPLTKPGRTLLDLAGQLRPRALEQAIARAERLELTDADELRRLVRRAGRRPGIGVLRVVLGDGAEGSPQPALTRSPAEEVLLAAIRRARLPAPELNARVGDYEADFFWPALGVVVEVDGFAHHSSRRSFERDHRRDLELASRGLTVVRVTWRQITAEPDAVLVRLARTLALAEAGGVPRRRAP